MSINAVSCTVSVTSDKILSLIKFNHINPKIRMKDKIVAFIKKLKAVFTHRRMSMPSIRNHQPYIKDIETDEAGLEVASAIIEKLDETNPKVFATSALYYLIEKVIPIFRNWQQRIAVVSSAHIADVSGHIKAKNEHAEFKSAIQQLLVEINTCDESPLIAIQAETANPGVAIVKQYESQREQYLQNHNIQVISLDKIPVESAHAIKHK